MMRVPLWILLPLVVSCSLVGSPGSGGEEDFDISRMTGDFVDEEQPEAVLSEEERTKLIRKRFPGLERLDHVRVLLYPDERRGPCWAEVAPPEDLRVTAKYDVAGWTGGAREAHSFAELREQGWRGIYRTPAGMGFERPGELDSIDLTVDSAILCTCRVGSQGTLETVRRPVRMRLRWQGKGHVPEVSGRSIRGERSVGLQAGIASGSLLAYEFAVKEEFPKPQPQACRARFSLQLRIEPPFA